MLDLSDGLARDAGHIAAPLGLPARDRPRARPAAPTARRSTTSASARTTSCSRRVPDAARLRRDRPLRGGRRRRAAAARRAGRARRLRALPPQDASAGRRDQRAPPGAARALRLSQSANCFSKWLREPGARPRSRCAAPPSKRITVGSDSTPWSAALSGSLVDVHLGEADPVAVLGLQLLQRPADRRARAAPGRPEVDDDGPVRLEHLGRERRVGDLEHAVSVDVRRGPAARGTGPARSPRARSSGSSSRRRPRGR